MSIFNQKTQKNITCASKETKKNLFMEITSPTTNRPKMVKLSSRIIQRQERDKKTLRKEKESAKIDPLSSLSSEEIDQYAVCALKMFQHSLDLCSSESGFKSVMRSIKRLDLGKYVDETFSPNLTNLVGENLINRTPWRAFVWLQPHQFCDPSKLSIFGHDNNISNISPEDVQQGLIGDSYLIASLASLAEQPNRIEKLFVQDESDKFFGRKHGIFAVKFYVAGHPFELVMDDFFPCISEEKGPAFAKLVDGKLWPLMIEKACAKAFYSYDNIEGGLSKDILRDLTGAPVKSFWTDEKFDELWNNLVKARELKYPMTCCSKELDKKIDFINEEGIVSNHVYSLMGGYEVKTQNGVIKLVKVRTVYPDAIWKGKWSIASQSKEWDSVQDKDKYINELNAKKLIFYINFDDFIKYFETCQFCFMDNDFKYSYQTQKINRKKGQYFRVTIKKEGKYYFTASQDPIKRYSKSYRDKNELADITLIIGQMQGEGQYRYLASMKSNAQDVSATYTDGETIPAGTYIIYTKVQWPVFEEKEITLSVYGTHQVRIDDDLDFIHKTFLENAFLDYAEKYVKNKISLAEDGAQNSLYCAEKLLHGFAFVAVWNKEQNKKLKCEFRIKNMKDLNLRLKKTFSGQEIAVFEVLPGKSKICLIRVKQYKDNGEESNSNLYHSKNVRVENL